MSEVELLSIGDTTFDTFITPTEVDTLCEIRNHEALVCFSYGDKIPVKAQEYSVGGNAANNSVGTTRLGVKAALVTVLGDDVVGDQTVDELTEEGVNMDYVIRQKDSGSNYSTIVSYGGERTIFSFRSKREYSFPTELPKVEWAYLTSMAENFDDYYKEVARWAGENKVKLAFNPGSRQIRAGVPRMKEVLQNAYIVYVNRSEAERMTGMNNTKGKEKELLSETCKLGPKISIITDGVGGSYVFDGENYFWAGVFPVDAFERTGAGDSFGSGCVAGLIKGKTMEEALMWGTLNSASVIGFVGSQKGLLTEEKLADWIEKAKSCKVEVKKI